MRKKCKKGAVAALALALMLGLSACGSSADKNDPDAVLQRAQENLSKVNSMSYDMKTTMEMTVMGQTAQMDMSITADYIMEPIAMKMDMKMDMGMGEAIDVTMYMVEEAGGYVSYTYMDVGFGPIWMKENLIGLEEMQQYDAQESIDMYISSGIDFQDSGTETIDGVQAKRYDGIISREYMSEVLEMSGVAEQFASVGMSSQDVKNMLAEAVETMPVSIWVDTKNELPIKYEMDMTELMQRLIDAMLKEMDGAEGMMSIEAVFVSMTITGIDNVTEIVVPAEALEQAILN